MGHHCLVNLPLAFFTLFFFAVGQVCVVAPILSLFKFLYGVVAYLELSKSVFQKGHQSYENDKEHIIIIQ
jgi:hypothetical protein